MSCFKFLRLYLWKNWIQKKRHPWSVCFEILCPVVFVALMSWLYTVTDTKTVKTQSYECLTETLVGGSNDLIYLPARLSMHKQRIALIVPETAVQNEFLEFLEEWYPTLNASVPERLKCDLYRSMNYRVPEVPGGDLTPPPAPMTTYPPLRNLTMTFESEEAMSSYVQNSRYGLDADRPQLYAAIVFKTADRTSQQWHYALRMNMTAVPDTSKVTDNLQRAMEIKYQNEYFYYHEDNSGVSFENRFTINFPGFAHIQDAVDRFIINKPIHPDQKATFENATIINLYAQWGCNATVMPSAYDKEEMKRFAKSWTLAPQRTSFTPFPISSFSNNPFFSFAANVFAIFFVLSFLFPASRLIRGIVHEKETKIREGLKMMGMPDIAIYSSWFITYTIMFFIVAVLVAIATSATMFKQSDGGLIFFFFFFFGLATTSLCYLISVFFSKAKLASVVGTVLFIGSFFPYYTVSGDDKSSGQKGLASLSATVAFGLSLDVWAQSEGQEIGLNWSNMGNQIQHYSIATGMFMILFDAVLYTVLGWYLGNVLPSEFGLRKPWYFCFVPSYWCGSCMTPRSKRKRKGDQASLQAGLGLMQMRSLGQSDHDDSLLSNDMLNESQDFDDEEDLSNPNVQKVGTHLRDLGRADRCVKIRGLTKKFNTPDGVKVAVDDVDMTMYEGQIFVLLGHNGAGKSTTISMATGLIPSTAGHTSIFGQDVATELDEIRKHMGVCPQHDVLFDDLTVREHLQLFAGIKGVDKKEIDDRVLDMIAEVGLTEKVDYLSSELSGGQKRKLSVGIALIGDSKIVFLDEPTSGMDPYSRRSTWNVLQNNRDGRIMILTTHFMDEADLLGDRIAIMADGKIRCCGTSIFLKHRYGVGYNLTMVKGDNFSMHELESLVGSFVPNFEILSNVGTEVAFQLPLASSKAFPEMFASMEENGERIGLRNYGISVTTLEEVFLKVADEDPDDRAHVEELKERRQSSFDGDAKDKPLLDADHEHEHDSSRRQHLNASRLADTYVRPTDGSTEKGVFARHFAALLMKRFQYAKRDRKAMLFQLFLPVLALLAGLLLLKLNGAKNPPMLTINTKDFNVNSRTGDRLPNYFPYNGDANIQHLLGHIDDSVTLPEYMHGSFVPPADYEPQNATSMQCLVGDIATTLDLAPALKFGLFNDMDSYNQIINMSQRLLVTKAEPMYKGASRYGAMSGGRFDAASASVSAHFQLLQNSSALHAVPTWLNVIATAMLRDISGVETASITVDNHPFPWTNAQHAVINSLGSFAAVLFIVIAFSFIPASYAVFIVKEREINAKHQQLISGVSIPAYWLSTYLWDIVNYLVPCTISIILIVAFDVQELVRGTNLIATMLLFLEYGICVAAFTYIMTYAFKSHSTAQTVVLVVNLFCMVLLLASFIMARIEATCPADHILKGFYRLMPGYALGNGLLQLSLMKELPFLENNCGSMPPQEAYAQEFGPFSWVVTGASLLYMSVGIVVYFAIAIGIDILLSYPAARAKLLKDKDRPEPEYEVDEDVADEADRVAAGAAERDVIVLDALRKVYKGSKTAVRNMSFGIPTGECFGFLGINGAGKTTTLKILSGDVIPTSGTARLAGKDILHEQMEVRRLLGYCPQFDSLLDLLTVREHLELYAKIKGVPKDRIKEVVKAKLGEMDLVQFENKLAGTLSGGNKRKLSVAIAMIGNPPIVFLDEPSTGMDPVARRFMWDVIARIATERKQCSIILTTHSMEECEALCTRVGIMVGGRLRCLGSVQHLKNRFGRGYQLELKLQEPEAERISNVSNYATRFFDQNGRLPLSDLETCAEGLGDVTRAKMCVPDGSGWAIAAQMDKEGSTTLETFSEWWAAESITAEAHAFINEAFPGAKLVERHGDHLRYQLPETDDPLSTMFGKIESEKTRLSIQEYSLSQTSLEQIFNHFAAQQDEEKGQIRGMVQDEESERPPAAVGGIN